MTRVVCLMYHELEIGGRTLASPDPGYVRYVVHANDFRAHLARLRAGDFRGVSVGEASVRAATGPRRVAITFDDGCETDLSVAAPALHEVGFGATFYVTVEHLGRRGYLSRAQVRELAELDFDIGSHGATHRYVSDLPTDEISREVVTSKQELESITGRPVVHFSCPGGRWDIRVARAARAAGYETVATSAVGKNGPRTDPFRLRRVAVMRGTSASEIVRLASGRGLARRRAESAVLGAAKELLGTTLYERLRSVALQGSASAGSRKR